MTSSVLLGFSLGGGVLLTITGLFPSRPPLAVALNRIHQPRTQRSEPTPQGSLWSRLVGAPVARTPVGSAVQRAFAAELRVAGRQLDDIVAKMALAFLTGLVWPAAVATLMAIGGVRVSWMLPAWGSLALAVSGAMVPLSGLRAQADRRRRSFLHAMSCFLDLVAVRLAGGAGVDGALNQSAQAGQGWAFTEIRQSLAKARLMGEPPWSGLARLGDELAIPELGELAASAALAGAEGARVRVSLGSKARAIRTKGLADAESAARSASERMSLPVVLLMFGFVTFLGYPAVMQVLTGL